MTQATAKFRRKPPRALLSPRLLAPAGFGTLLAVSAYGFVHFTLITLYQQAHFAPEFVHPWDGYAALSLFFGMASLGGLLLSLRDPAPMRWRRGRQISPQRRTRRQAKQRRAGTITKQ